MAHVGYEVVSVTLDENGQEVESNCIDISFINYGTGALIINNNITIPAPATAGQFNMITIGGNVGEIDKTKYTCKFGAGTKSALAIRRVYKSG
jgi:hypothetical protein